MTSTNPTNQDKLLDFVNNPDTIKQAAEGSMEKRAKVMEATSDSEIEQILDDVGAQYESPFRYMKDLERPLSDQIDEARSALLADAIASINNIRAKDRQELIARVESLVGDKEYYREHYPFTVTQEQLIEMKEATARDNLRHELHEGLDQLKGETE